MGASAFLYLAGGTHRQEETLGWCRDHVEHGYSAVAPRALGSHVDRFGASPHLNPHRKWPWPCLLSLMGEKTMRHLLLATIKLMLVPLALVCFAPPVLAAAPMLQADEEDQADLRQQRRLRQGPVLQEGQL